MKTTKTKNIHRMCLKLNKNYFPIRECTWREAIYNMSSGQCLGLDLQYSAEGEVEGFTVCRSWGEWVSLPVRDFDDFIHGASYVIRAPKIVICTKYKHIKFPNVQFPTKRNIWKRDNYVCQYTGKALSKGELSIDHIIPKSRGGEDSWENLVTCDRGLNSVKSDMLPEECGLKLIQKPNKPKNTISFDHNLNEWKMFTEHI